MKNIKSQISRLVNGIKITSGYLLSLIGRKAIVFGLPISISVEPVNYCNLQCPECPSGNGSLTRPRATISLELFKEIINQAKNHLAYLTLYFQGEPLLHPNFSELVTIARKEGIYTASSTNAQLLTKRIAEEIIESGLNKLIVSVDGTTQEVYEKYRVGGKLEKVIAGIEILTDLKKKSKSKKPFIELQFLVFKHNEKQIPAIKKIAKELAVNRLSLKTAQIYDFENGSELIPTEKKYARYVKQKNGSFKRKKKIKNKCWRAFSGAVITANGDVLPCSYDKNGEYSFGNINEEALSKIWRNEKATYFRQQLLNNRSACNMCNNCTE